MLSDCIPYFAKKTKSCVIEICTFSFLPFFFLPFAWASIQKTSKFLIYQNSYCLYFPYLHLLLEHRLKEVLLVLQFNLLTAKHAATHIQQT